MKCGYGHTENVVIATSFWTIWHPRHNILINSQSALCCESVLMTLFRFPLLLSNQFRRESRGRMRDGTPHMSSLVTASHWPGVTDTGLWLADITLYYTNHCICHRHSHGWDLRWGGQLRLYPGQRGNTTLSSPAVISMQQTATSLRSELYPVRKLLHEIFLRFLTLIM